MKKFALLLAAEMCLTALVGCGKNEAEKSTEVEEVTLTGTADGFAGPIEVEVVKSGDDITAVNIKAHEESVDDIEAVKAALESVPAAIVEKDGTEVDIVAGATYTSNGIIEAVNNALAEK